MTNSLAELHLNVQSFEEELHEERVILGAGVRHAPEAPGPLCALLRHQGEGDLGVYLLDMKQCQCSAHIELIVE